ncbi:hypothetical protein MAR_031989 [Mya arenaria]|uniref:Uncharacterized protein n=1 Tax=Mya arenaria TaxID=6604 RepID=A0ABY7F680_MYAAR|nr:hypothetical protein MAR_031989 [Mya arenaria]
MAVSRKDLSARTLYPERGRFDVLDDGRGPADGGLLPMLERQLCPVCCRSGTRSFLKSYQINLDEACTYPLGQDGTSQFTYSRKMSDLPSGRETDFGLSVPPSQSELQARAHSRMRKLGLLQNDAKAIQTGSPQLLRKHRQSTAVSTARASSRDATLHLPHSYAPYSTPSSSYQSNTAKASYKNRELRKRRGSAGSSDRESLNSSNDNLDSGSDKSAAIHNASLRRTVKSSTVIEDCLISKLFAAHDQAMKLVEKINTKTASEFNSTEEGTGSVSSKGSRKKRSTSRQKSSSSNGEELKTDERPLSPNSYEIEKF